MSVSARRCHGISGPSSGTLALISIAPPTAWVEGHGPRHEPIIGIRPTYSLHPLHRYAGLDHAPSTLHPICSRW
jgi:hypothetical protein